jgi:hypothetical protein
MLSVTWFSSQSFEVKRVAVIGSWWCPEALGNGGTEAGGQPRASATL